MFFICCSISSGLKDEAGPGCEAGVATGGLVECEELLEVIDMRLSL